MNVIIEIYGGIIENVITCKCSAQAGLLYVEKAKEMGVELDDEEIDKMSYDDSALSSVIEQVENYFDMQQYDRELKWFESHHYKRLK